MDSQNNIESVGVSQSSVIAFEISTKKIGLFYGLNWLPDILRFLKGGQDRKGRGRLRVIAGLDG